MKRSSAPCSAAARFLYAVVSGYVEVMTPRPRCVVRLWPWWRDTGQGCAPIWRRRDQEKQNTGVLGKSKSGGKTLFIPATKRANKGRDAGRQLQEKMEDGAH